MEFGQATTRLISGVTLKDLARETGVTHGFLRLSRLDPDNPGYRNPPSGWEGAVLKLARRRATELSKLVDQLARDADGAARRSPARGAARKPARAKKTARSRRSR